MELATFINDHAILLEKAARLLGEPVCAVTLEYRLEQLIKPLLRREERRGLDTEFPLLEITCGPRGQDLEYGIEKYRLDVEGRTIGIVRLSAPVTEAGNYAMYEFWAVPVRHRRRLYRLLRRRERESYSVEPPIMEEEAKRRLWSNSIGFLRHGREQLRRYNVPQKRGILLTGEPGNGKTMACRWLYSCCTRLGYAWRNVTVEAYQSGKARAEIGTVFELDEPGIILFDDFEQAFYDRDSGYSQQDLSVFLNELDGLHPREGVVYLFTTNAGPSELDPAFQRPGRIDLILEFKKPAKPLRRRCLETRWDAEILEAIDVERAVEQTEGLSFAELEEVRKLLVLNYLETGCWDWAAAWEEYRRRDESGAGRKRIGFADVGRENGRQRSRASFDIAGEAETFAG